MTAPKDRLVRLLVERDAAATPTPARYRKLDTERKPFARPDDESWRTQANCLGLDTGLFFPERGGSTEEAKAVCAACPVREECGQYALEVGEHYGVWGGVSEKGRRQIREPRMREAS